MRNFSPSNGSVYTPTSAQLERTKAFKRFNRLYVYLPIFLGSLIIVGLWIFLGWITFSNPEGSTLSFVSGLADLILILILLPMVLIGLIGPLALFGLIYWAYNRRKQQNENKTLLDEGLLIQKYSWQAESFIEKSLIKVYTIFSKAVKPIMQFNVWITYVQTFLKKLLAIFTRS